MPAVKKLVKEYMTFSQFAEKTGVDDSVLKRLITLNKVGQVDLTGEMVFSMADVTNANIHMETIRNGQQKAAELKEAKAEKKRKRQERIEALNEAKKQEMVEEDVLVGTPISEQQVHTEPAVEAEIQAEEVAGLSTELQRQISNMDEKMGAEFYRLTNHMTLQLNTLSDRLLALEEGSSKSPYDSQHILGPDSKSYSSFVDDGESFEDQVTESYADYMGYIDSGSIVDLNNTDLKYRKTVLLDAIQQNYSRTSEGTILKDLKAVAGTHSLRSTMFTLAALGSLQEDGKIRICTPRSLKTISDSDVRIWSAYDHSKHFKIGG